jgi:hypothetical protein
VELGGATGSTDHLIIKCILGPCFSWTHDHAARLKPWSKELVINRKRYPIGSGAGGNGGSSGGGGEIIGGGAGCSRASSAG